MDSLNKIKDMWNKLAANFNSPLLTYEWFLSCAQAFYRVEDLHIIVLFDKNHVTAIAPLAFNKINGTRCLELLGTFTLHEPSGLLYDSPDSLRILLDAISNQNYPCNLSRLPYESDIYSNFKKVSAFKGILFSIPGSRTPYLDISTDWDRYFNSLSSRRRYDYRKSRRMLEELGPVDFKMINSDDIKNEKWLNLAFDIEASGWKGGKGSAIKFNSSLISFFKIFTKLTQKNDSFRMCFLQCNEQFIAMLIGIEFYNKFWVIKIGYNDDWAKYSPGIQLIFETIKWSFERNLHGYEFLGSNEDWIRIWTHDSHEYTTLVYYPYSIRGMASLTKDTMHFLYRKLSSLQKG